MPQMKCIQVRMRPVLRDERVIDDKILAARAAEARHVPVVVDLVVAAGHQTHACGGCLPASAGRHDPAEHCPLAEVASTGERPAALETITAIDPPDRPRWRQ